MKRLMLVIMPIDYDAFEVAPVSEKWMELFEEYGGASVEEIGDQIYGLGWLSKSQELELANGNAVNVRVPIEEAMGFFGLSDSAIDELI